MDRDIRQFLDRVRHRFYTQFLSKCMWKDDAHSLTLSIMTVPCFVLQKVHRLIVYFIRGQSDVDRQ